MFDLLCRYALLLFIHYSGSLAPLLQCLAGDRLAKCSLFALYASDALVGIHEFPAHLQGIRSKRYFCATPSYMYGQQYLLTSPALHPFFFAFSVSLRNNHAYGHTTMMRPDLRPVPIVCYLFSRIPMIPIIPIAKTQPFHL